MTDLLDDYFTDAKEDDATNFEHPPPKKSGNKPTAGVIQGKGDHENSTLPPDMKQLLREEQQRMKAAKGAKNLKGRIVGRWTQNDESGSGTGLLIGLGSKHGVIKGMRGVLGDGRQSVEITEVMEGSCKAKTSASHDMIVQWNLKEVTLNPAEP